ncbi:hypothetical protein CP10139811_0028 [Chlamydia ibidis]|uniref:DNA-directed DNA polymerase n=2 Tax=Chlamydia ibidis TaxID=1405396 RepID=S7J6B7_9CHLA|nr:hypothetical protein [Chlamydia ibidis]EPP35697.1 hypothetical protein CP10139811_0028 [Chlamydia ibidis]EQM62796.1 hypothetical protein H359_0473 [Chlamydia ibidis 10-1398/6]
MQEYLTCFQEFSQIYLDKSPPLVLVGSGTEEDREVIPELLISQTYAKFDGSVLTIHDLALKTENYGIFGNREYVVIFQVDKLSSSVKDFLISYSKNPHPHVKILLFTTKSSVFQSLAKQLMRVLALSLYGEWSSDREKRLSTLLSRKAESLGVFCPLSLGAVFLKKFPQAAIHDILGEFHKLLCHIGGKQTLEYADIEKFTEKREQVSLWKFRDALLRRDLLESRDCLHALIHEQGEDPLSLIAFLRSQCLFGLRSLEEGQEDRKFRNFISYGSDRLHQALSNLFYAESIIKNNQQDPIIAVETLIIRMTRS